jgi:hypothetical protein
MGNFTRRRKCVLFLQATYIRHKIFFLWIPQYFYIIDSDKYLNNIQKRIVVFPYKRLLRKYAAVLRYTDIGYLVYKPIYHLTLWSSVLCI